MFYFSSPIRPQRHKLNIQLYNFLLEKNKKTLDNQGFWQFVFGGA